jgi:hypothetical protein
MGRPLSHVSDDTKKYPVLMLTEEHGWSNTPANPRLLVVKLEALNTS